MTFSNLREQLRPTSRAGQTWVESAIRGFLPPPRLSVPDWADKHRKHAPGAGSARGDWDSRLVMVGRQIQMAVTEPGVQVLTVKAATQVTKTALLQNIFGYFAHLDPCPMLMVQPKDDAAKKFSKEQIEPMISATPVLRKLFGRRRTRTSDATILEKYFSGGFLALTGPGNPDNLARRPIRVILYDEVDKYLETREGPVIPIGERRLASFSELGTLSVRVCSPTIEGESAIDAEFIKGDQRRASMACPACGHRLFAEWKHVDIPKEGNVHLTEQAAIQCEVCQHRWSEGERIAALQTIRFHQTRPFHCCGARHDPLPAYGDCWRAGVDEPVEQVWDWWEGPQHAVYRARCPTCGRWPVENRHASYEASKLFSPWAADRPPELARVWIDSQGDQGMMQVFWNTLMAKAFRSGFAVDVSADEMLQRAEIYECECPEGVAVITVGVDTQGDRVEIEWVGWGRHEESWSLGHEAVHGDPKDPQFWAEKVDPLLLRRFRRSNGREVQAEAVCIDSGGGAWAEITYRFSRERLGRNVWAIKGESARGGVRGPIWPPKTPTRKSRKTYRPIVIGVNTAKDTVKERLTKTEPGPGYCHFPHDREPAYFAQFNAERLVWKTERGRKYRVWEAIKGRANEALDLRVYAYAALIGFMRAGFKLNARADLIGAPVSGPKFAPSVQQAQETATPDPAPPRPPAPRPPQKPFRRPRGRLSNRLRD